MNERIFMDIPRVYTALAEWAACTVYVYMLKKRNTRLPVWFFMLSALVLQCLVQIIAGMLPILLWIPGMMAAIGLMLVYIYTCCTVTWKTAGYYTILAFILAEFTASFMWQLYYHMASTINGYGLAMEIFFVLLIYGIIYGSVLMVEKGHVEELRMLQISFRELISVFAIGITVFFISNLSFVYTNTPFSAQLTKDIFNTRTLIDLSGLLILYAYHVLRREMYVKYELNAMHNILQNQYTQYRQSQENIDLINRKYHDLKHQIAVLRCEQSMEKRMEYIDAMESEIKAYEAQFETGNPVVDTILTGKTMTCQKYQIELTCVVDGTLLNFLHVADICSILGNALDNAIESSVQIQDQDRRLIHLTVSKRNHFVVLRFENYFEGNLKFTGKLPVTTKRKSGYHGFGLKSIQYTARKYGGYITVNQNKNWFELNVMIPYSDKNSS